MRVYLEKNKAINEDGGPSLLMECEGQGLLFTSSAIKLLLAKVSKKLLKIFIKLPGTVRVLGRPGVQVFAIFPCCVLQRWTRRGRWTLDAGRDATQS